AGGAAAGGRVGGGAGHGAARVDAASLGARPRFAHGAARLPREGGQAVVPSRCLQFADPMGRLEVDGVARFLVLRAEEVAQSEVLAGLAPLVVEGGLVGGDEAAASLDVLAQGVA